MCMFYIKPFAPIIVHAVSEMKCFWTLSLGLKTSHVTMKYYNIFYCSIIIIIVDVLEF